MDCLIPWVINIFLNFLWKESHKVLNNLGEYNLHIMFIIRFLATLYLLKIKLLVRDIIIIIKTQFVHHKGLSLRIIISVNVAHIVDDSYKCKFHNAQCRCSNMWWLWQKLWLTTPTFQCDCDHVFLFTRPMTIMNV